MPPLDADRRGYVDGLRKLPKSPSRGGYPVEYEAAYRRGLLDRSPLRRALDHAGRVLLRLAER